MNRLQGKVAIVTGGAGAIGSATVTRFIAEGARVVVADIAADAARAVARKAGENALAIAYDAADSNSVKELVESTVRHFGRLDILFNNAGLTDPIRVARDFPVAETDFEIWDQSMMINARGCLAGCKFAIPHMLRNGGSIINMSSLSGLAGDLARTAYGASKAAVVSITKYVATQYGRKGIRCNAIAPGLILTEASKAVSPELLTRLQKHVLTPEFGEPADIAALCAFLASPESKYITAQTISCDGGLLAHLPQTGELLDLESA
jgi:NAD(P)-dependent dehydrogenase (short-subunit alcohol dehydrogenase family)